MIMSSKWAQTRKQWQLSLIARHAPLKDMKLGLFYPEELPTLMCDTSQIISHFSNINLLKLLYHISDSDSPWIQRFFFIFTLQKLRQTQLAYFSGNAYLTSSGVHLGVLWYLTGVGVNFENAHRSQLNRDSRACPSWKISWDWGSYLALSFQVLTSKAIYDIVERRNLELELDLKGEYVYFSTW